MDLTCSPRLQQRIGAPTSALLTAAAVNPEAVVGVHGVDVATTSEIATLGSEAARLRKPGRRHYGELVRVGHRCPELGNREQMA